MNTYKITTQARAVHLIRAIDATAAIATLGKIDIKSIKMITPVENKD